MGVWQSARDGKSGEALTSMTMLLHAVQEIPAPGAMTLCVLPVSCSQECRRAMQ